MLATGLFESATASAEHASISALRGRDPSEGFAVASILGFAGGAASSSAVKAARDGLVKAVRNTASAAKKVRVGQRAAKSSNSVRFSRADLAKTPDNIQWPDHDGFDGMGRFELGSHKTTLKPGEMLDRFGGPGGKFVARAGTPFFQRSLPPSSRFKPYYKYKVQKNIEVEAGFAAPWFKQRGEGLSFCCRTLCRNCLIIDR